MAKSIIEPIKDKYDVIIIGGGATGSGIALDASLRGLNCVLFEKNDFSSATSSRSTKLVHGGVRYLEAAVKNFDFAQYSLVKEALKERYYFLQNASFLAKPISLVTPIYSYFQIPYMFSGLTLYDLIAGKKSLGKSSIVSKKQMLNDFPSVKKDKLKAGIKYYDGAFNDSRMTIALLQSAKKESCDVYNYHEVINFLYEENKIAGVTVQNNFTKKQTNVYAKSIVNASGIFSDRIRKLDNNDCQELLKVSSGVHIVLDKKYLPNDTGLMIPKTKDGRVLFILPYQGKCLVGTTDEDASLEDKLLLEQKDIDYLLEHLELYFDMHVSRNDILSLWVGLRPLVQNANNSSSKEIVREHYIEVSNSNLLSILGGKWTTYRKMAEEVVDKIEKNHTNLKLNPCQTKTFKLVGNQKDLKNTKEKLNESNIHKSLQEHLILTYGDQSLLVLEYLNKHGFQKLHDKYSFTYAEVFYSIDYEFTHTASDFLNRRSLLGLIDTNAKEDCRNAVENIIKTYSTNFEIPVTIS